jgi:hypothetical protein
MSQLSERITEYGQEGWRLHSVQPIPVFGGFSQKQQGLVLLAVYERERA